MKTVLVVDDDAAVRELIEMFIKTSHPDAVIIHAEHGAHAWKIISTNGKKPNLVISDVNMPEMNGIQLAEKIRKEHPDVHVILMSGGEEPRGHKAHAFLGKPVKMSVFLKTIERFIRKKVRCRSCFRAVEVRLIPYAYGYIAICPKCKRLAYSEIDDKPK